MLQSMGSQRDMTMWLKNDDNVFLVLLMYLFFSSVFFIIVKSSVKILIGLIINKIRNYYGVQRCRHTFSLNHS